MYRRVDESMKLDRVKIEGFKSIKSLDLELRPLNILIGANGVGKSNFVSFFKMLNQIVELNLERFVRQGGGADSFLYFGRKKTPKLLFHLFFSQNAYRSILIPTVDDLLIFEEERVYFHGHGYKEPFSDHLGSGHKESKLIEDAKQRPGKVASHVLNNLKNWVVYHFHDTSESAHVKRLGDLNDNIYLRSDAANLAAFLYKLKAGPFSPHYEQIRETIRMVAPFFDDFILRPDPQNQHKIRLEWREKGSDYPFLAHHLSDGTLRFMCLATLLLQPLLPSTILLDEPELGLHPSAITVLTGLLRGAASKTQVIVSTQSVTLINQFEPDDLIVVERDENTSVFKRLEKEEVRDWVDDYGLGEMWEKNIFGGRP